MSISPTTVLTIAEKYGTPVYVYDQSVIEERIKQLKPFGTIRYAQKALSNLAILAIMRKHGVVVDAVSAGELYRSIQAGFVNLPGGVAGVIYTADILDEDAIDLIRAHQIPINAGSIDMLEQCADLKLGVPVILRINPGFGHGHSKKVNTGGIWSKHGIWHEQLDQALNVIKERHLILKGIHMHIGSGTDIGHLGEVASAMHVLLKQVVASGVALDSFDLISAGGGLSVPYKATESAIDVDRYREIWHTALAAMEQTVGKPLHLEIEPGRFLVAESGWIISKIRAKKYQGPNLFYLLDAGLDTLVRPAMYGAYHEMTVVPQSADGNAPLLPAVVAGPLCESGDVFTQLEGGVVEPRLLPEANIGDYVLIHNAGAYTASMASQYNSRLLAPEILISNNEIFVIRERQPLEDVCLREAVPAHLSPR